MVFLGGPLNYLYELRKRFAKTLGLSPEDAIFPENAHLFVAMGAALSADERNAISFAELIDRILKNSERISDFKIERLKPLFESSEELERFRERHRNSGIPEGNLAEYNGPCFLGIDAGSTTTKAVLIDNEGRILYSFYARNRAGAL